jgi:hypothetical protein
MLLLGRLQPFKQILCRTFVYARSKGAQLIQGVHVTVPHGHFVCLDLVLADQRQSELHDPTKAAPASDKSLYAAKLASIIYKCSNFITN